MGKLLTRGCRKAVAKAIKIMKKGRDVDKVVTRCRGREIDKKNVSRQRYTTPETHGSATATRNGQSSLSLFFIGAACAGASPFFYFF
jgi:hypothetical protein